MADSKNQFPAVQGGGSLIIAWQIKGKTVLVVGGGEVAAGRILNCLNADARVVVVSPSAGLNPEVAYRVAEGQVDHIDRKFEPGDLDGADMVLVAIDEPDASTEIWKLCKERRIPANIADVPPECDFYFGSMHRDGPLQIMVSTNGKGPRLASTIRKQIAQALPKDAGKAIESIGELRGKLRKLAPAVEEGPKRMRWMIKVSDAYSWDQMCGFSEEDMDNLLRFYAKGEVPSLDVLVAMRGEPDLAKLDLSDATPGASQGTASSNPGLGSISSPT
ncbi:siroheme synthase [Thozetella sp. PMI_491]|nr:siroheme synthase [Thozetella sp. PMI_491]